MAVTTATCGEQCAFPPFPTPPVGVLIVPFSAFRPAGYRHIKGPSGDEIEVDASAGIPTIKVLNEEEVKQKRRENKKRKNAGTATDAQGRLIPWWEEWEVGEASRTMSQASFESHTRLEDRIYLAADDFRVGRTWPEIALGVRLMWDQFRLYIGLLSSIPVYRKIKNNNQGQVDGPNNAGAASDEDGEVPRAKRTKADIVQDYFEQTALPGKQLEPSQNDDSTVEAQRLRAFLGDIETTIKVFLSSYMRDTGLIWAEKNLLNAPTILHFFLRFMHRNKVFADSPERTENLERAVSVAALARKELTATAKLGQMLPGRFDIACKECWGTQGNLSIQISASLVAPVGDTAVNGHSSHSDVNTAFETELKEDNIEIVPSDVVLDSITARQVMEDNLDTDHAVPVTTIPVAGDPWTAAVQAEEYTTESWTDVSVPWLMQLLGPTVFPLVMATGIVEYSTRRIRNVIAPGARVGAQNHTLSAVEDVLEKTFFSVVMSPWVTSASEETADFPKPVITPGSRGAVIAEMMPDGVTFDEVEGAWDPYQDDLTVLVDKTVANQMVVGMGLCGTWVEMVAEEGDKKHNYWYVESLVASFPSYYTEGECVVEEWVEGEDEEVVEGEDEEVVEGEDEEV